MAFYLYVFVASPHINSNSLLLQIKEIMAAAEQTLHSQLAGPTIALLDDMPSDLWTRLYNRLSTSTAAAAQVNHDCKNSIHTGCCVMVAAAVLSIVLHIVVLQVTHTRSTCCCHTCSVRLQC